ncbi:amidohydrolase family protein [Mycobacterium sp. 663a-19]|uniref:amidohydrolase family protein n=1 Tax=Mycobacterium sp. 663a-19 TaxID=2986148 RepID=UPI002D1F7191|nr:amidohydrolase family protein [Mycobacterium sp. 663a-19]MEB3980047.1 amidohydrolase family protein [Mycobacterium sp. 663a-19]
MRVDVHTHLYPSRFVEAAQRVGAFEELAAFKTYRPLLLGAQAVQGAPEADAALASRIADMEEAGIDRSVLSVGAFQPYLADAATAADTARIVNDEYREIIARYSERFVAFAALPLPHIDQTLEEIRVCAGDDAFAGVGLGCSAGGYALDDERFAPVWAELDRYETVVFLHPGVIPGCAVGSEDFALAPMICGAAEIAVAVLRLVVRAVTTRYPRVRFVVATTGGSIPLLARRFDDGFRRSTPELYAKVGGALDGLRSMYYDTSIIEERLLLLCASDVLGADRLVFGSDTPRIKPIDAVRYIEGCEHLTAGQKRAILDLTAQSVLGIGSTRVQTVHDATSQPAVMTARPDTPK